MVQSEEPRADGRAAAAAAGPETTGTRALVRAAAAGDEAAWRALYERYRLALRGILHRHMRDVSRARFDTEDVLQSTFLSAYTSLDEFEYRGPDSFRRWLAVILRNKLADQLKHHARARRDPLCEAGAQPVEELADDGDTPSVILSRFESQRLLLEALSALDLRDQEVVTLRYFERRTWPEVGAALGVAEATARRRMLQALERLMDRLGSPERA